MIRKVSAIKFFRDRKQNKFGTWVNVDVVENQYILQSLEDGSYIVGTGRGEGADWGSSSVTLAEADAFKNFVGNTFCLVTDSNAEEVKSANTNKKPDKAMKENVPEMEPVIVNPVVKLKPPVPSNEVVQQIDKNIDCDADGGKPLELPKEAFGDANSMNKPISAEPIEPSAAKETVKENAAALEAGEIQEKTQEESVKEETEPSEEVVSSDSEIKSFANVICPVRSKAIVGKTFEEICAMAISNSTNDEITARKCLIYVASHTKNFEEKAPDFAKACVLAVKKFNLAA